MILMRRSRPRVAELWFEHDFKTGPTVDVAHLRQWSHLPEGAHGEEFQTLVLDLQLSEDELQKNLDSGTAYEVRRAIGKDATSCEMLVAPSAVELQEFVAFYNDFAGAKGLKPVPAQQMEARAAAGVLRLTRAVNAGQVQVWHAYVLVHSRARLLYSASQFRSSEDKALRAMVGRANRGLHWFDMLQFKQAGAKSYDFGGWYSGDTDEQLLSVNRFKKAFGGTVLVERNAMFAATLLGRVYLTYMKLRAR